MPAPSWVMSLNVTCSSDEARCFSPQSTRRFWSASVSGTNAADLAEHKPNVAIGVFHARPSPGS